MQIKIGADPELFINQGGVPVSAWGLIPGTKKEPFIVKDGAVQVDGMALEFNIDPAEDKNMFVHNVNSVLATLRKMVPADMEFNICPSAFFDPKIMEAMPIEATALGCDPDYNAYTGDTNPAPKDPGNMRVAGGHVHVGWTEGYDPFDYAHFMSCQQLVKQLDYCLGIPSLVLDLNTERRQMYGKAGAFRPKSYGVEYRVLSNFWIKSPELMQFVYDQTQWAFNSLVDDGRELTEMWGQVRNLLDESYPTTTIADYILNNWPARQDAISPDWRKWFKDTALQVLRDARKRAA